MSRQSIAALDVDASPAEATLTIGRLPSDRIAANWLHLAKPAFGDKHHTTDRITVDGGRWTVDFSKRSCDEFSRSRNLNV